MADGQTRAERAAVTRQALVDAARGLFAKEGYFATGTEDIVAAAGVGTRGALYHHFEDKKALFEAVVNDVQRDLPGIVLQSVRGGDALEVLTSSLQIFLDTAAQHPDVQQILLIDGPAVLGWERWRAMEADYSIEALVDMLQAAVAEGLIEPQPLGALAHMLLALVDEAALYIANADEPATARAEVGGNVDRLISGLRVRRRRTRASPTG